MKNSQISMFLTICLTVLIVVAMAIYMVSYVSKKLSQKEVKLLQKATNIKKAVESYVLGCAEKELLTGITLLGKQGGAIYKSQGGTFEKKSEYLNTIYLNYQDVDILYSINISNITLTDYKNPDYTYPWFCFPYFNIKGEKSMDKVPCSSGAGADTSLKGDFGKSVLVPLLKTDGDNSIQETLENYINNNLTNCLDFIPLEKQGLTITTENPKASLSFLSENLVIKMDMPTTIFKEKTYEEFYIDNYELTLNIRLGKLYSFISEIVGNDTADIIFDIQDTTHLSWMSDYDADNMEVSIQKDANSILHDDVITVKDKKSRVGGGLVFTFARKNRRPALRYINDFTDDLVTQEDFEPWARDPDEDTVTYTFNPSLNVMVPAGEEKDFKVTVSDGGYDDSQEVTVTGKQ